MSTLPWLLFDWNNATSAPLQHILQAIHERNESVRLAGALLHIHPRTAPALVTHLLSRGGLPALSINAQCAVITLVLTHIDLFVPCEGLDALLGGYIADPRTPWRLQETATQALITWLLRQTDGGRHYCPGEGVEKFVAEPQMNDGVENDREDFDTDRDKYEQGQDAQFQPVGQTGKRQRVDQDPPFSCPVDCDAIAAMVAALAPWASARALASVPNDVDNDTFPQHSMSFSTTQRQPPPLALDDAAPTAGHVKGNPRPPVGTVDVALSEDLLSRCRAHHTSVLRATGGSKGAAPSIPAKTLKQLAAAAAPLLTAIAALLLSPPLPLPLPVPAPTPPTPADAAVLSISRALLALALHRAPDELLAEIATQLFPAAPAPAAAMSAVPPSRTPHLDATESTRPAVAAAFVAGALLPKVTTMAAVVAPRQPDLDTPPTWPTHMYRLAIHVGGAVAGPSPLRAISLFRANLALTPTLPHGPPRLAGPSPLRPCVPLAWRRLSPHSNPD